VASVDRASTVLANVLRPMHGVLGVRPDLTEAFLGQRDVERRRFGAFA
jgi:hypothetical protein